MSINFLLNQFLLINYLTFIINQLSSVFITTFKTFHLVYNIFVFRILVENGVKLSLTVIDTPGFGEAVDNTECWTPIVDYVEDQFDAYLEAETRVERFEVTDTRVHACLYFIAPTGHGLKPLDVEVMKKIHKKVNIIPVIGKADSCTVKEVNMFKTKVRVKK